MEYEKASPKLQEKCLMGEIIPKLEIELTSTYGGARATYLKFELKKRHDHIVPSKRVG